MDTFTRTDVKELVQAPAGPCVSLFLPTHRSGEGTRQDPIRLKNLLGQAEEPLRGRGLRSPDVRDLLAPAVQLLDDSLFWKHQSDGLVVFLAPGAFRRWRVPLRLEERAVVADRFHLKPLFPLLTGDGHFYVLALSQNAVRLLEATRHAVDEIEPNGLPASLAEALPFDELERQLQYHTRAPERAGKRAAVFHGHGPGDEEAKDRLLRYFREIDAGLREVLREERAPLVLAGVEYYLPIYREANGYPHLLEQVVAGSPEALRPEELHARAWALVEPHFRAAEEAARARFGQLAGTGKASADLAEVVTAAWQGRVEVLFVATGVQRWGAFDADTQQVRRDAGPQAGGEDLLDLAAARTFLNGGTVYAVEPGKVPNGEAVAAVFRY